MFNQDLPLSGLPYRQSSFLMEPGAGTWEILQTSMGDRKDGDDAASQRDDHGRHSEWRYLMKPYLLDRVVSAGGEEVRKFMPEAWGSLMSAQEARISRSLWRR